MVGEITRLNKTNVEHFVLIGSTPSPHLRRKNWDYNKITHPTRSNLPERRRRLLDHLSSSFYLRWRALRTKYGVSLRFYVDKTLNLFIMAFFVPPSSIHINMMKNLLQIILEVLKQPTIRSGHQTNPTVQVKTQNLLAMTIPKSDKVRFRPC